MLRPLPIALLLCASLGLACTPEDAAVDGGSGQPDAGAVESGPLQDAGSPDAGFPRDAGADDAGSDDAGSDAGQPDAGLLDAGDPGDAGASVDAGAGPVPPIDCTPGCTTGCNQGCFALGPCSGAPLSLHANIETVGVVLPAPGDEDATLYYRPVGQATWHHGQPLHALPDGRAAGSVFGLLPSMSIEVRATRAGATYCGEVTTLPAQPAHTVGATLHVDAAASPGGDGTAGAPFATIQAAVDAAGAGSDIVIHAGLYHESVVVTASGAAGAHLRLLGETGAVLSGAPQLTPMFETVQDRVWRTAWTGDPRYLRRDDARMYHYLSLAGLQGGIGDDGESIAEGFFATDGWLYVRSTTAPDTHTWHIPTLNTAIALNGRHHVWIEGLELRDYGEGSYAKGIDIRDSDDVVVMHNHVHNMPSPIWVRRGSHRVHIAHNHVHQSATAAWPWAALKGTDHENTGIQLAGGTGAIAYDNEIHDIFNGIYAGSFSNDTDASIAFDVDVYKNRMWSIGDDGLEPEGACVNHRYRENAVHDVHNGISLAPVTFGPTYVVRNRFTDYAESGFKVSNNTRGFVLLAHNTSYTDRGGNGMNVSGRFSNITFRNNIIRGNRYAIEVASGLARDNDLDFNAWFTTRGAPWIKWNGTRHQTLADFCAAEGHECSGIDSAPGLTDPGAQDVSLSPQSPCIDAATSLDGLNDRFHGTAPDIGAVEYAP